MKILKLGSRGPDVKLIQSLLSKIGYNPGPIDGIYGPKTQQAVIAFQRNNNLLASGIVEDSTWQAFQVLLNGYSIYYVQRGDTIYNIARKFYTTAEAIITANPQITPNLIYIGQRLVVPYGIDIVFTDIDYTYDIMERNIFGLKARYPFLEIGTIGKSVLGRNLYYLRLGRGTREVSYNAAHHSLEWITSPLLMKFAENFLKAYATGNTIRGYNIRDIWNQSSIYIVPMVNPDGVDLVLNGLSPSNPYYNNLLQWNQTGLPFSEVWNANIRSVDLNRNYPASWEEAKAQEAFRYIRTRSHKIRWPKSPIRTGIYRHGKLYKTAQFQNGSCLSFSGQGDILELSQPCSAGVIDHCQHILQSQRLCCG